MNIKKVNLVAVLLQVVMVNLTESFWYKDYAHKNQHPFEEGLKLVKLSVFPIKSRQIAQNQSFSKLSSIKVTF